MKSEQDIVLILGCLLFGCAVQRNYTEIYTQTCKEGVLVQFNITEEERTQKRNSQVGPYLSVKFIVDAISERNGRVILSKADAVVILMMVLVALCLISFIVFLCFCCCCDRAGRSSLKAARLYNALTIVLLITSIGLFIALLVYLGNLNSSRDSTSCTLASVPKNLFDGVQSSQLGFFGFNKLVSTLTDFKNELPSIKSLSNDFSQIVQADLPSASKAALDSLSAFSTTFRERKTTDGAGEKAKPQSVSSLTDNINIGIFNEFTIANQAAVTINNAGVVGQQLSQAADLTPVENLLSGVIAQFSDIVSKMGNALGDAVTGIDYFNYYAPIGYWLTLGICLLIFILGVTAVILICLMVHRDTNRNRMGVKFCLSLSSFFIFLLGIIAIVLLIASVAMNSVCRGLGEVLSSKDINAQIQSYGVEVNPIVSKVINQCLPIGSKGEVSKLLSINSEIFTQSADLMEVFSLLGEYKKTVAAANNSPSISATIEQWQKYRTSEVPDHSNTASTVANLNSLIECSGQSLQLNKARCSTNQCQGIFESAGFSAPACSLNGAQAETLYNRLKTFTTEENQLMGEMIEALSGNAPNTPRSLQRNSNTKMTQSLAYFDNITPKFKNTFSQVSNIDKGLQANLNCSILRKQMNDLEVSFCFNFSRNLYYFTVMLIWIVFFMFFYSWSVCCSLRFMPINKAISMPQNEELQGQVYDHERLSMY